MKKKFRKTAALFMTLALTAGMLAGCGGDTGSGDSTSASSGSGTPVGPTPVILTEPF